MEKLIKEWKINRNKNNKHNVIVCSRNDFPVFADILLDCQNIAFISIENTEDCAQHYRFANEHYLKDNDNILNIEFDDIEDDIEIDKLTFRTITQEQADKIVDFIESHLDCDFIIHCRAGKSRSQAIFRFMMDFYPSFYEECELNRLNPCLTPNMEVVRKLKRNYYIKNGYS